MTPKTIRVLKNLLLPGIFLFAILSWQFSAAQIVINEGSNRNYSSIADEDGEFPDWIELYNAGNDSVNLFNYSLSDDSLHPAKWVFPNIYLHAGEYKTVFCSSKNRKPVSGFTPVLNTGSFSPVTGWNMHSLTEPFYWDGISNLLINTCSYRSLGYTTNSIFNQSSTSYNSSIYAFQDGSPYICGAKYGTRINQRPNMKLNNLEIDTGVVQNNPYSYPAPYGNWYWAAKNQMLIRASELAAAGLSAGPISTLAFDVAWTDTNTVYDYIDIEMKMVSTDEVTSEFETVDTNLYLHTNFKIASEGEIVSLYSPTYQLLSSLFVNCFDLDNSVGSLPDATSSLAFFQHATPSSTNNNSTPFHASLLPLSFSVPSGMYNLLLSVEINNVNGLLSTVHYTTDGSDPTTSSPLYTGSPITIYYSEVLKARAFADTLLPSPVAVSTYFLGVNHFTPVLSVVTDNTNLYGTNGIFDHWQYDWQKAAYVEYFDSAQQLIFSQRAGIQIDGGWGGSRERAQHSFRVELKNGVLGDGPVYYPLIPDRPDRTQYGRFYLRNGSNQFLTFPYKDACEEKIAGGETNNYFTAWRPVTVYINGAYFGLYELREKVDAEYFHLLDNANTDSIDILTQTAWNSGILHAIEGSAEHFDETYSILNNLNQADTSFWTQADHYLDMNWYNDYIIAESWIGNTDWPWNNIKMYRSDMTNYRWRFCLADMELALQPNGWTSSNDDHIHYMMAYDQSNPYIHLWQKGIQNYKFRNYFINRFADLMNTTYLPGRVLKVENSMFDQTVMEMPEEYQRWGDPNQVNQQMNSFINNHLVFQTQLTDRSPQVRNHIQAGFSLNGQVNVTLNVLPVGAGRIKISTIIPDSLPWTGVYFDGNPVRITALSNLGYHFNHWQPNVILGTQNPANSLELNISSDATFTAVFSPNTNPEKFSISEINYHSDSTRDAGDWIEFHNYSSNPLDISGWRFSDSVQTHNYAFPSGTVMPAGAWIVLAEDTLKFHSQHPGINVLGPMGFTLSNSNKPLTVYDNFSNPVIWMHYDDSIPWPPSADGYGRTLELVNDTLDPSIPWNWFAGCIGGSPGGPYIPCSEQVIFSEINYKSSVIADAGDWVELYNKGLTNFDLSGWKFHDGDDTHTFALPSGTVLPPAGYLVLYSDYAKFSSRFPGVTNIIGPFSFGLSSGGEDIRLFDLNGNLYQSVYYQSSPSWPQDANGNGYTLEIINMNGNFCEATNWMDGCPEGSPGGPYVFPCPTSGVQSIKPYSAINIFPNPSNGILYIEPGNNGSTTTSLSIQIFNSLGKKIYDNSLIHPQFPYEINLMPLPAGVYFIRIDDEKKIYSEKIIILSK